MLKLLNKLEVHYLRILRGQIKQKVKGRKLVRDEKLLNKGFKIVFRIRKCSDLSPHLLFFFFPAD